MEGAAARRLGPPALVPVEAVVGGAKIAASCKKGWSERAQSLTYCPHVHANTLKSLIVVCCNENYDTCNARNRTVHTVALIERGSYTAQGNSPPACDKVRSACAGRVCVGDR